MNALIKAEEKKSTKGPLDDPVAKQVKPTAEDVTTLVQFVFKECQLEVDCIISSFIYLERLAQKMRITARNFRPAIVVSMLLASKGILSTRGSSGTKWCA
jgi:hypothetical protein